ncbi:MAG: DUF4405 domain-containing protein [Coriobacteriia bacterium]
MSARARLGIDAVLVAAFLASYNMTATGLTLHEWIAVGLALLGLFHLALNWDWVVHTAESFLARLLRMSAVNLVVDIALFATTVMVSLSGIVISRVVGPLVGLTPSTAPLWYRLHSLSAVAVVALFVVHGVLHWKWILNVSTRWLSDARAGSNEEDAKKNRFRPGRHRNHRARHVGRRDRRNRNHAQRWGQDGVEQDGYDFQ